MEWNKEAYCFEDFIEIIRMLRSDQGCPWDRAQTHMSLRPCLSEETAEVLSAIRTYDQTGDYENLKEELGDVLLQVALHAQIAGEEGIFTIEDVISGIARKMVRRHPHVFGTDPEGSRMTWEEIKRLEKEERRAAEGKDIPSQERPLGEIPKELPALTRGTKVAKKTAQFYAPAPAYPELIGQIKDIALRLEETDPQKDDALIADQVGRLLTAVCEISHLCKLSPEQILDDEIAERIKKYEE